MNQKLTEEELDEIISNYTEYIGGSWYGGDWGIASGNIRDFAKEVISEELKRHHTQQRLDEE